MGSFTHCAGRWQSLKHQGIRFAFLFTFLLTFAMLLVLGAPRLIASAPEMPSPICEHAMQTYLCAAPIEGGQVSQAEVSVKAHAVFRMDAALVSAHMSAGEQHAPGADANGNVLMAASYMRSVYQVFALGDGFA